MALLLNSVAEQGSSSHRTAGSEVRLGEFHFTDKPHGPFHYRLPEFVTNPKEGQRFILPFGKRRRIGFLTRILFEGDKPELRNVEEQVDERLIILPDVLQLIRWMATYYLCEIGEVLSAALPAGLKRREQTRYGLTDAARAEMWILESDSSTADLLRYLQRKPLTRNQIQKRFMDGTKLFIRFQRRGWLEIVDSSPHSGEGRTDLKWIWQNLMDYTVALNELPKNARKLRLAVDLLREGGGTLLQRKVSRSHKNMKPAFEKLVERGWVERKAVPVDYLSSLQIGLDSDFGEKSQYTPRQSGVVREIAASFERGDFKPILLHGVTGSGKTLMYLEAVELALGAGRGVIVMVPEIGLTPQLLGRFRARFGDRVIVTHSGLSGTERDTAWRRVHSGKASVVIGPRSVVFAPVNNLGLVVVDEEHDESYKQAGPNPRYNGRDAALYRASKRGALALIGSATPDVASYYNAASGRYKLLNLPERYQGVKMPDVWVVKHGWSNEGSLFSKMLITKLERCLKLEKQAILLVNRRGFSSCIRCPECGDISYCPNCDITLRYHKVGSKLECHYCGFSQQAYDLCRKCRGHRLIYQGVGTQRVEKELNQVFPEARVRRMDLDTMRGRGAHHRLLGDFSKREFDILLGTQMVAKGHDFPNVSLVGVIAADYEWLRPDFRTSEKAFRLLVQAAGRTGRTDPGEVVIQAWEPEHPLLRDVQNHDYRELYERELSTRELLKYPPFSRLISILIMAPSVENAIEASQETKMQLSGVLVHSKLLGPAPPPTERIENLYRRRLLIKLPMVYSTKVRKEKDAIHGVIRGIRKRYDKLDVRIILDVDPLEV